MKFKNAFQALGALRQQDPSVRLPLLLFWQSLKNLHHWTNFAVNGRIIGFSEGFSAAATAAKNYDLNFEQAAEHVKAYWI